MKQHKEILAFIKVIRDSFHDSYIVYSYGGCYGFYQILKYMFPKAKPYFETDKECHIITKIGGKYYDVKGECYDLTKPKLLTKKDREEWQVSMDGQRIEWMVAKYNKMCKDHQE